MTAEPASTRPRGRQDRTDPQAESVAPVGAGGQHARHRLDEVIHAPVRLSIVSALARVDEAQFGAVRDALEVADSVLSKQVATLEAAGYVKVRKGYVGKRPRTWLSLTPAGRGALRSHVAALREIAGE